MSEPRSAFAERARAAKMAFVAALPNARAEQDKLLARYLHASRDTDFGRAHGFSSIATRAEYARAVPVRTFADLAPWVDRVVAGERGVLTHADPVLFLSTTGTTGAPKVFPVVREYLRNSVSTMLAYWASLLEFYPAIGERGDTMVMLYLAPKPFSKFTAGGLPIHNPTHLPADVRSGFPFASAPWFPPPAELSDAERLFYIVRRSAEGAVRGLACLHPSRLQSLTLLLAEQGERLIREIHDGELGGARVLPPNPQRAKELEAHARAGGLTPKALWPLLEVVSCWTGGSFRLYLPEIRERYGAEIFPQTSSSSEAGHLTLPIRHAETDGPLNVLTNFYEFLPVVDGVRVDGPTLACDELELGRSYEIVLTSCSGFYRYVSGDVFRVIGFEHGVPCLEFAGRGGVSDMTGEKISEEHVIAATQAALAACSLEAVATTCVAVWGRPPHYEFVLEAKGTWPEEKIAALTNALDAELSRQSSRYELKRGFGDLAQARVRVVPAGSFQRYRESLIAQGLSATQLKDRALHTDAAVLARIAPLTSAAAPSAT